MRLSGLRYKKKLRTLKSIGSAIQKKSEQLQNVIRKRANHLQSSAVVLRAMIIFAYSRTILNSRTKTMQMQEVMVRE